LLLSRIIKKFCRYH